MVQYNVQQKSDNGKSRITSVHAARMIKILRHLMGIDTRLTKRSNYIRLWGGGGGRGRGRKVIVKELIMNHIEDTIPVIV